MSNDDEYEVGYKKPPLHSRIKPGERRNPRGRPKGSRNVNTIIKEVMEANVEVTEKGKKKKRSVTHVVVMAQVKKAAKDGDTRAAQYLLDRKAAIDAVKAPEVDTTLSTPDASLLEDYRKWVLEEEEARRQQEAVKAPTPKTPRKKNKENNND